MYAKHISYKGIIPKIHKSLSTFENKKQQRIPFRNGDKEVNQQFLKEDIKMAKGCMFFLKFYLFESI